MTGLSQRAYARHRGISHTAVQKAIKASRITVNADGTIDPARADTQWGANTLPAAPAGGATAAPGASYPSVLEAQPPRRAGNGASVDSQPPPTGNLLASRAVREAYRARRERLSYERESAALVPLEEVRAKEFALGRRIRDRMLAIPDRLAPVVAGLTDPAEWRRLLTEAIRQACEELSRDGRA